MDRTGSLVPPNHLQTGVGHEVRKEGNGGWGEEEEEDSKTQGGLPPPFCPRMHGLSMEMLSQAITLGCKMQLPWQMRDLKISRVHLIESSYRNKDVALDLCQIKISDGKQNFSKLSAGGTYHVPTHRKKGAETEPTVWAIPLQEGMRSFCCYRD